MCSQNGVCSYIGDLLYVYILQIHLAVQLKLTQHCKAAVLLLRHFSHVQFFVTPCTVARLAPMSMKFSRQEY